MNTLGRTFVRVAKSRSAAFCMADSTGRELTYGRALVGALILSRIVRTLAADEECIGILLPASVGGALANIGTSIAGKIPVNLNFTAGHDAMVAAVERCRIRTVLTSRAFLSRAGIETLRGMIYVEDLLRRVSPFVKARVGIAARLLPAEALTRRFVRERDADALATIIFSSGSTGVPKGVMLTHRNILSNITAALEVFHLTGSDVMLGVLPFFHSFGFTGTLWLPIVGRFGVVYHPNPMDAKTIGELAAKYGATVLISTPTFCASYIRKCSPEQFAHLRYAIVGAEKLREPIAAGFRSRFGMDLIEGYGCTEMSPIVAVNTPERRPGSVGRPVPGTRARVVDPVTGEGPLVGEEGVLLVSGPSRMRGYLEEPELTRSVFHGDWYITGDIAKVDADGFIYITDRLSRFSKIAGEMVPHMKVEEEIQDLLADGHAAAVISVADEAKGERLVAFYTDPHLTPQQLWERLAARPLPNLWIPKRDDLRFIEQIPTLGSGKVDLRGLKQLT